MISEKVILEVVIDRATNKRFKKIVGYDVLRNVDLSMAIARLLDSYEAMENELKVYKSIEKYGAIVDVKQGVCTNKQDNVNNPAHYNQGGIECIDAIRASMTAEEFAGFLKGNAMKYLWRYKHKGKPVEDLQKMQFYSNALLRHTRATEGVNND